MTRNTTVTPEQYEALQGKLRHLIIKHDPLFMPGDTLLVSMPDERKQIPFEIVSVTQDNINQKGALSLIGLYAPYTTVDDVPESVGGGSPMRQQANEM